jgi:SAM-dependent methyltransferase
MKFFKKFLQKLGLVYLNHYRKMIVLELSKLIDHNSKVLDFGCDDGRLSYELLKLRPDISIRGIDIQSHRNELIDKVMYDGKKLPFKDNSFDCVFCSDVLHHCPDLKFSLEEIKRVSKKSIVIKDHIYNGTKFQLFLLSMVDWCFNIQFDINCHFNFKTKVEWYELFHELDLYIKDEKYLKNVAGKKFNPIFVLRKIK